MKFTATLLLDGKTATGIEVPAAVVEALGAGRSPAVQVRLNGYVYRSSIGVRQGAFKLPVSSQHRAAAGVSAGDVVEVEVKLDSQPRRVDIPDDLERALAPHPEARTFLASLSVSQQQRCVGPIVEAKKPETRERRIGKAVEQLRHGIKP